MIYSGYATLNQATNLIARVAARTGHMSIYINIVTMNSYAHTESLVYLAFNDTYSNSKMSSLMDT